MIRVIIADDHELFRGGLRLLLETKSDISVVGETGTGRETIDACASLKPDVVLLDLDMPDMDGIEVTRQIASSMPDVRVLIVTMFDSEEYAARLIREGASGYIVKGTSPKELPDAIRKVASGSAYITPSIAEKLAMRNRRPGGASPLSLLSTREIQVLTRIASGQSILEIADELCLSNKTIETYKSRTMSKLEMRNVSDLTRFAIQQGLIKELTSQ